MSTLPDGLVKKTDMDEVKQYLDAVPEGHVNAHGTEMGYQIIGMLMDGMSLREIAAQPGMPAAGLISWWCAGEWEGGAAGVVSRHHARARVAQGESLAAIAVEMVRDLHRGHDKDGRPLPQDAFKRYRVALDSLRWMLPKMARATWGDHLQIEHKGQVTLEAIARAAAERGTALQQAKQRSHGATIEGERAD